MLLRLSYPGMTSSHTSITPSIWLAHPQFTTHQSVNWVSFVSIRGSSFPFVDNSYPSFVPGVDVVGG